ncbi:hypothetical protein AAG570_010367, partial [Ranatra chinensis]
NYITACSRNAADLNECVVKSGQEAIPKFINGDPKYRVPNLNPLEITELQVNQGTKQVGLKLTLRNAKIYGMKNAIFKKARTDLKNRHIEWDFEVPRIEILGDYTVEGQVLILPITGNGKGNITITELIITYKYDWKLTEKKGKEFMELTKSELLFENGRTYFDLKNLFNGDNLLGSNMNRFLNENWKEVTREVGPAVGEAIAEVFKIILTNIAQLVPFSDIYQNF